ncbi:3'-5' exonuclease [Anaerovibrio sp.]|uniref:3'-5' exonuclease n=1 Tax=Anaerovibrio sp. TaxID=1872532 RepID=UPI0025C51B04|nr:3'-5' exonuclease [Anaerovibrio sp.]MBR2143866.1 3'-5' exonuclease [Anaerovibrio sp.]
MHIACLDTESTSTGLSNEILDLSILNEEGETVHSQLYKPKKVKKWYYAQRVHGISPKMVEDKPFFASDIDKVQTIFDSSDMLLGFAIDNDIRLFEQYGLQHLSSKSFDVKDLYWAVFKDDEGLDYYHVPNLVTCAENCGYEWREGSAHSAIADAEATLSCFNFLVERYVKKYHLLEDETTASQMTDEQIYRVWNHLRSLLREERHKRAVEKARGVLYLVYTQQGYAIFARKKMLSKEDIENFHSKQREIICHIELADSQKGYEYLLAKFASKIIGGENYYKAFYDLEAEDIELFRNYTNEFIDEDYIEDKKIKSEGA